MRSFNQSKKQWYTPSRFDIDVETQVELISRVLTTSSYQDVTVNLTLQQFSDSATASALASFAMTKHGPRTLTVEITEVPDLATMRRITAKYRDAGVRILIDDVGSDNSYELVNKLLPYVDGVKFAIQNLRRSEPIDRIWERLKFWVDVAQQQSINFILEGVEDESDVQHASALGIHYFQGYYFGKPAFLEGNEVA